MRHTATSQLATPDPLSDEEKKRLIVSFLRTEETSAPCSLTPLR